MPCWGYEPDADSDCLLYKPDCPQSSQSWTSTKAEQRKMFFETADFGYVKLRKEELQSYCSSNSTEHSKLECTKYLRYCQGRNLYIDLKRFATLEEPIRYREDVLTYGDVGGWDCEFDRRLLLKEGDHKSALMSWYSEISNFKVQRNQRIKQCDVWLEKPTFVMKLDATSNMYHHFCDFLNLYLSLHVNNTQFNLDNHILIWDSYGYRSNFHPIWKAFTSNPILSLNDFRNKRVCFKDVIFPLLPRMIFGLYYNMPLIPGCSQSGIFRAFNRHLLFYLKLNSSEESVFDPTIHVTFLTRNTRYRQVLNQDALIHSLEDTLEKKGDNRVKIRVVDFNHRTPFVEQVKISSTTDVLIGMHGAGLTHVLFQPDYGVLFELFNCDDSECYKDLSRLRGLHYMTWQNRSLLTMVEDDSQAEDRKSLGAAHAKFVNYRFESSEFVKQSLDAIEVARKRKALFRKSLKPNQRIEL